MNTLFIDNAADVGDSSSDNADRFAAFEKELRFKRYEESVQSGGSSIDAKLLREPEALADGKALASGRLALVSVFGDSDESNTPTSLGDTLVPPNDNNSRKFAKNETLILVIDMQNVYREGEDWACHNFQSTLDNICKLLDMGDVDYAFTECLEPKNLNGCWGDYREEYASIMQSKYLNDLAKELTPYQSGARFKGLFSKQTFTANSAAINALVSNYKNVIVVGVVDTCCCLATAFSLIDLGRKVLWIKDALGSMTPGSGMLCEQVLTGLSPLHVEFLTASGVMAALEENL